MKATNYTSRLTDWIKIDLFCEQVGMTKDAVKAKRYSGVWRDGFITKKAPDGTIFINLSQFDDWVNGRVA